ncbi:hypothetical protein AB0F81_36225 [Actinoplanes sp. NPDC024001]|uniref:hypothetical protein n=1 Tax=Actinoplanes sp. NPDC024001 TaxID=3154598 RepID=UPI0033E9B9FE
MTQRRTWWLIAAALALVLVGAGVLLLRRDSDRTEASDSACRLTAPPSATPNGDVAGLEVVEKGFSLVGADRPWVSSGAVLRNATERVAYRTLVTIDALDARGRTLIWADHQLFKTQVVPVLGPGASITVGNALAVEQGADRGRVASIAVTFVVTQWLDPAHGEQGLGAIATAVVPGSGKRDPEGSGSVSYTATSTNCAEMKSRGTSMVFRDSAGKLIGGALNNEPQLSSCDPGHSTALTASTVQLGIPADADLDRTSVTVYCDFDRPFTPVASGVPVN